MLTPSSWSRPSSLSSTVARRSAFTSRPERPFRREVDRVGADGEGGDRRTFDDPVRIAPHERAVLERRRFAFGCVDDDEALTGRRHRVPTATSARSGSQHRRGREVRPRRWSRWSPPRPPRAPARAHDRRRQPRSRRSARWVPAATGTRTTRPAAVRTCTSSFDPTLRPGPIADRPAGRRQSRIWSALRLKRRSGYRALLDIETRMTSHRRRTPHGDVQVGAASQPHRRGRERP